MKVRTLIVVMVLAVSFLFAGDLYAANGNLVIEGSVGVGTEPVSKLDVAGDISFVVNGVRLVAKYVNAGEDDYGTPHLTGSVYDNCNNNNGSTYTCPVSANNGGENGTEGCRDLYPYAGYWYYRTVKCRIGVLFTNSETL